jgi:starch-binding outer membrane protein, SusD/RagB family
MKKIFKPIIILFAFTSLFWSCHDIDVDLSSRLTPDIFPLTEAQFNSVTGTVYSTFRGVYAGDLFWLQSTSTDETIVPSFGGNWFDGGKFTQLHLHSWTKDNAFVNSVWWNQMNLIGTTNQTIYILSTAPESSAKKTIISELKMVRALSYYWLMDVYGNVPIDTVYPSTEVHANTPRAQVFDFVEKEIKNSLPYLKRVSGQAIYGRPNAYMAYALLARMYLNANVYTGTQRNNECIVACDSIIKSELYTIESRDNYLKMFYPDNGPKMGEFIFAIPFDATFSSNYLNRSRMDLNRNLGIRYKYSGSTSGTITDPVMNMDYPGSGLVNNRPSGPCSTLPEFCAHFTDPNDIRNQQWLKGLQYWEDGSPIMVKTTNLGFDAGYSGSNPKDVYIYHLNLTSGIQFRAGVSGVNAANLDVGNDEIAWNMGYRNIKFYPDYTNTLNRNQNNDVPIFRFSDILLMKAEAILRGGTVTLGQTALSLVNELRAKRSTSIAWNTVNLDSIYNERCRELAYEQCHRTDMIRFGKFEDGWGFKTDKNTYKRLFPIPTDAFSTNNKLVQNPGYE